MLAPHLAARRRGLVATRRGRAAAATTLLFLRFPPYSATAATAASTPSRMRCVDGGVDVCLVICQGVSLLLSQHLFQRYAQWETSAAATLMKQQRHLIKCRIFFAISTNVSSSCKKSTVVD